MTRDFFLVLLIHAAAIAVFLGAGLAFLHFVIDPIVARLRKPRATPPPIRVYFRHKDDRQPCGHPWEAGATDGYCAWCEETAELRRQVGDLVAQLEKKAIVVKDGGTLEFEGSIGYLAVYGGTVCGKSSGTITEPLDDVLSDDKDCWLRATNNVTIPADGGPEPADLIFKAKHLELPNFVWPARCEACGKGYARPCVSSRDADFCDDCRSGIVLPPKRTQASQPIPSALS